MATLAVTFDRSSLALPDLVIGTYPTSAAPWWIPPDGVVEPAWAFRTTYAPESAYAPGTMPLAAVLDASSFGFVFYVQAGGSLSLSQAKRVIEAAASQWAYDLTVNIDGSVNTYEGQPAWPQWGQVDPGMTAASMAKCSLTVPVNPLEA